MKTIRYGMTELHVADDVAYELLRMTVEFSSAGQAVDPPVACYLNDTPTTVVVVVGPGIPLLMIDRPEDERPDPPQTLASWEWIKSATDVLQDDQ